MSELPAGWARAVLGEIGVLYTGQSPSADTVNQEGRGTSYVTGPEQWDGGGFHKPKWTSDPRRIAPEGCIFITVKGGGVGKTFPGIPAAIGRDIYAYQPSNELDFQFILRTIAYRMRKATSRGFQSITLRAIRRLSRLCPSNAGS
jgi:type I restriction enzyme S subunit